MAVAASGRAEGGSIKARNSSLLMNAYRTFMKGGLRALQLLKYGISFTTTANSDQIHQEDGR